MFCHLATRVLFDDYILYMYLLNVPTPLQNLPQIALDSILKYDLIDCRA